MPTQMLRNVAKNVANCSKIIIKIVWKIMSIINEQNDSVWFQDTAKQRLTYFSTKLQKLMINITGLATAICTKYKRAQSTDHYTNYANVRTNKNANYANYANVHTNKNVLQ